MRTRVFQSGNSRAVRLPKGFELPLGEAEIEQRDGALMIRPPAQSLAAAYDALAAMPADVCPGPRHDPPPQSRAWGPALKKKMRARP